MDPLGAVNGEVSTEIIDRGAPLVLGRRAPAPPTLSIYSLAMRSRRVRREWTEETAPAETEEEDRSPRGTDLPPSLLASVTEIFLSKLGYEAPVRSEPGLRVPGCWRRTRNVSRVRRSSQLMTTVKGDWKLAEKQPWTAFPSFQERAVRVAEGHWETLFKPPSVSDET